MVRASVPRDRHAKRANDCTNRDVSARRSHVAKNSRMKRRRVALFEPCSARVMREEEDRA
jgi:hypothetical protein